MIVMHLDGGTAYVSEQDRVLVESREWYVVETRGLRYVRDSATKEYLHRLVLSAPDAVVVDHINGNGLDCRRSNLRVCTHAENLRNRGPTTHNKSGYKGVSWHKRARKWQVHIKAGSVRRYLGLFEDAAEAARAYDKAALALHGAFAYQNLED